jgi:hypothetical protein
VKALVAGAAAAGRVLARWPSAPRVAALKVDMDGVVELQRHSAGDQLPDMVVWARLLRSDLILERCGTFTRISAETVVVEGDREVTVRVWDHLDQASLDVVRDLGVVLTLRAPVEVDPEAVMAAVAASKRWVA